VASVLTGIFLWGGHTGAQVRPASKAIPLHVDEPTGVDRIGYPVKAGVPFPQGALASEDNLRLVGADGKEVPCQVKRVASWPRDGSVMWVWVDFLANVKANAPLWTGRNKAQYSLEYGPGVVRKARPARMIEVAGTPEMGALTVTTGPMKVLVKTGSGAFLSEVWLGGKKVVDAAGDPRSSFLDLFDDSLDQSQASIKTMKIEESGPIHLVLRLDGEYKYSHQTGVPATAPFIMWLHFWAGSSLVKVEHTYIYTGIPTKAKRPGDPLLTEADDQIAAVGLRLPVKVTGNRTYAFGGEKGPLKGQIAGTDKEIYLLQSVTAGKPMELPPNGKLGYWVKAGDKTIDQGKRAIGWADYSGNEWGVTVGIPRMMEEFPKELNINIQDGIVTAYLWPSRVGPLGFARFSNDDTKFPGQAAARSEVAMGVQGTGKSHETYWYFHDGGYNEKVGDIGRSLTKPSIAYVNPKWYAESRVYGSYRPVSEPGDPKYDEMSPYDEGMRIMLLWWYHAQQTEPWFGMIDYGDLQNSWLAGGGLPRGWQYKSNRYGWSCGEPDVGHMLWIQYIRTGSRWMYDMAEAFTRHVIDVDTTHIDRGSNSAAYNGPKGCNRRHYAQHWAYFSYLDNHIWAAHGPDYYFLAGWHRGVEVARESVDAWIRYGTEQIQLRPLGYLYTWLATGEERYKTALDKDVPGLTAWFAGNKWDRLGGVGAHALSCYVEIFGDPGDKIRDAAVAHATRYSAGPDWERASHNPMLGLALRFSKDPVLVQKAEDWLKNLRTKREFDQPPSFEALHAKMAALREFGDLGDTDGIRQLSGSLLGVPYILWGLAGDVTPYPD
jgi:hypothetical protein